MSRRIVGLALAAAGAALAGCVAMNGASEAQKASRVLVLDLSVKPLKDVRTSTCGPEVGCAGCLAGQRGWGGHAVTAALRVAATRHHTS